MSICIYCGYRKANSRSKSVGNGLFSISSPFSPRSKTPIEQSHQIRCSACKRNYESLHLKGSEWITRSLIYQGPALISLKALFPNVNLRDVINSVIGIAKVNRITYHVIFEIRDNKGYLDCRMSNGNLVLVDVWGITTS
jgi:hypothetical protein